MQDRTRRRIVCLTEEDTVMDIRDARTGGPGTLTARRPTAGRTKLLPQKVAILGLAALAACTSAESQMETGAATLPRPQVVIVDTFAASANEVTLDEGLSTEVEEAIKAR
jgi:hypothetical protein